MKKILITMPSMFLGGAERSLLGLLENFDYSKVEVYLFLFRKEGELLKEIPPQVKILDEIPQYTTFDRPIVEVLTSSLFPCAIARIFSKMVLGIKCLMNKCSQGVWTSMQYTARFLNPLLPKIPGEYDLAISFLGIPFYMEKIDAKKKMSWIHTGYSTLRPDKKYDCLAYKNVDNIVNVSEKCQNQFLEIYPELKAKAIVIENVLSKQTVLRKSEECEIRFDGKIKILSIGRFCEAKNFDNVPEICAEIIKAGYEVKWYLIGYGGAEELIRTKIIEYDMDDYVIVLGKKNNPYPYIKACDVYVQPSRYEGKSVTVREAQILNKPVIITNYATAADQVKDGVDGIIVPLENHLCARKIIDVIANADLLKKLGQNTKEYDYTNARELEKIYKIMEE